MCIPIAKIFSDETKIDSHQSSNMLHTVSKYSHDGI